MNPPPGNFVHRIVHAEGRVKLNVLKFDRCPKAWMRDEAPDAPALIDDFSWLKRFNVLPLPGGKLDQDPRFIDAVEVLELEVAREDALRRRGGGQADGAESEQ